MATPPDVVTVRSSAPFATTVARLRDLLTQRGITVFAEIDHARNAREAGLEMPPTVVLVFGNAAAGTPLMLSAPDIALDLPLRVMVREEPGGSTVLAYHDPAQLAAAYGVAALPPGIAALPQLVAAAAE